MTTESNEKDPMERELRLRLRSAVEALSEATRRRDEAEEALDAYLDSRATPPVRTTCFICGQNRAEGSEWCVDHTDIPPGKASE